MSNKIILGDCLDAMKQLPSESVNCIVTDPPYKYLKNQKLESDFCEDTFFNEAKRVLKKDGFIVLFGRGTSFYRWNVKLAELGFSFKEEFIWDKSRQSSPALKISRVHETISVHAKGKGKINKVKIPYTEMREHDLDKVIVDINRIKSSLNNTKSLDAMLLFLQENKNNFNLAMKKRHSNLTINDNSLNVTDVPSGILNKIVNGMNEKSIITQSQTDYYTSVHPTQKPVRLMERLIQIVAQNGDTILDPFMGSGSTILATINLGLNYIGCEIDEEYFNIARNRINEHIKNQKNLFNHA